jgi:hypothetical protein
MDTNDIPKNSIPYQMCKEHPSEYLLSGRCIICQPHRPDPTDSTVLLCFNQAYPNCQENIKNCWSCGGDHLPLYLESELCENNFLAGSPYDSSIVGCWLCGTDHHIYSKLLRDQLTPQEDQFLSDGLYAVLYVPNKESKDASTQCCYKDLGIIGIPNRVC